MYDRVRRDPVAAGTYYPKDPVELKDSVQELLGKAKNSLLPQQNIKALAAPHAHYPYSGRVAAEAHACLKKRNLKTLVIVGPDHYIGFEGIAVFPAGAFRTPLGDVEIDEDMAHWLVDTGKNVIAAPEAHSREHGIEVQLPFLQVAAPGMKIVPILMGFRSRSNVETLAVLLSRVLDRNDVCLMATTDLSHYHPRPQAQKLDSRVRELVRAFAPTILWEDLREGRVEACGGDSLVAVMLGAGIAGAEASRVLGYCDSGEMSGNPSAVVGYLSAAFYRGGPATSVPLAAHEQLYNPLASEKLVSSVTTGGDEPSEEDDLEFDS